MRRKVWLDSCHPLSSLPKTVLGVGRKVNGGNLWLISHPHMMTYFSLLEAYKAPEEQLSQDARYCCAEICALRHWSQETRSRILYRQLAHIHIHATSDFLMWVPHDAVASSSNNVYASLQLFHEKQEALHEDKVTQAKK